MRQDIKRMSVYLPPGLEAKVRERVADGAYRTANELMRAALRDLFEREPRGG